MTNRIQKFKERAYILLIVLPTFLLFGCGAMSERKFTQPASSAAIAKGDAENGRNLFMGYVHFENDGPPCMGCHNIGENGLLGGGALGPSLTNVSAEMTQTELASLLSNFGPTLSPVMQPIYTEHPLSVSEQADLIAFMKASVGEPETDKELLVLGVSILATIGAAVVLGFIYRNRLRSVRAAMVKEAEKELL